MSYKLSFLKLAESDLENILAYTAEHFGEHQYWIYRELLKEAFELLTKDPFTVSSRERNELSIGARTYNISQPDRRASHFILYRFNEEESQVEIGRILHKSMNFENKIPPGFS
jgi:plasmid stabilization system protein ParE